MNEIFICLLNSENMIHATKQLGIHNTILKNWFMKMREKILQRKSTWNLYV